MISQENEGNMLRKKDKQVSLSREVEVTEGHWGDVPWKFMVEAAQPDITLCTAAFCIVTYEGKVVLVEHNSRGYEFTGGHVDLNEDITQTVTREVLEEGRAVIEKPTFFGYKKVSPVNPIPHRDHPGEFYPFPNSYVPYFFAEAHSVENIKPANDIKSVRLASYTEAVELLQPGHNHDKILDYLVKNNLILLD